MTRVATRLPARAAAKINLALHVTGQRADGFHLLDSLVAFADVGDVLSVRAADRLALNVCGPMAGDVPRGNDNLVLRAARMMAPERDRGAVVTLEKNLPVAAGMGGGSADAAAALRLLSDLWQTPLPKLDDLLSLGADVPVCMQARAARMGGIGGLLEPLGGFPALAAVLVNPRLGVSTAAVFAALARKENPPLPGIPTGGSRKDWFAFLREARNDLEAPAMSILPRIGQVLAAIRGAEGCALARMSGSGATCFGLFETTDAAHRAARALGTDNPGWWVAPTVLS